MEPWFAQATEVPALEAEVCFLLQSDFYFGPDHPQDRADLHRLVEPLAPPAIPRFSPLMVRTSEAVGKEEALATYYEQVVRFARQHNRPFNSIRHCFWLRFWLWNSALQVHVSFPWYDSFSEIDGFIQALSSAESGCVHHDQDQGWEIEVHSQGGVFYVRERDPDADETRLEISTPRDALLSQLEALRERTIKVIGRLSDQLGADVWTQYVRHEPAFRRAGER